MAPITSICFKFSLVGFIVLQVDRITKLKAEGAKKERVHAEEAILTALLKKLAVAEEKDPDEQVGSSKGEEKEKK